MIGWSGATFVTLKVPVPWVRNCAPTSAMYFGEFRKQYDAQCSGMKPLPPSTKSSSAFSCSGEMRVVLA
jgi:hypothetical protein